MCYARKNLPLRCEGSVWSGEGALPKAWELGLGMRVCPTPPNSPDPITAASGSARLRPGPPWAAALADCSLSKRTMPAPVGSPVAAFWNTAANRTRPKA